MKRLFPVLAALFMVTRLYSQSCNLICNGSFDDYYITSSVAQATTITCWSTTATDGKMEVWGTGFNGVNSYNGSSQHIELNATQAATMYQDFPVFAGTTYTVCFAHQGRAGIDTMEVSVGPPNGPYVSLGRFGDGTSGWGYYCVAFTPTITGTYRVRFTPVYWAGGNNAIGNFLDAVSVNGPASFSVTVSSTSICAGNSTTLSVTGASTHSWSTSSTASAIVVSPSVTTTYTLRAAAGTCTAISTHTIIVSSSTLAVTSATVCAGQTGTLTVTGSQNYTWSPGATNGTILVLTPQSTGIYSINALSAQGCTASAQATITVRPAPAISFTTYPGTCASGAQATVQASGAIGPYSYLWLPGSQSGQVGTNLTQQTYTVFVTDNGTGCTTASVVSVPPAFPPLTASGSSVCTGQALFLYAFSVPGTTYTWTGPNSFYSNQANPQISNASPADAGSYTITITATNGCTNAAVVGAGVSDPPVLSAVFTRSMICSQGFNGSAASTTLIPGGANSYTLVPSPFFPCAITPITLSSTLSAFSIAATPPFNPAVTFYTMALFGNISGQCTASVTVGFTVTPNPTVTINTSTNLICPGETFTYSCTGAQNYTWTGVVPTTTFNADMTIGVAAPLQSAPFSVYGSSLGCNSASASGSVTVVPLPTLTVIPGDQVVCAGSSVALKVSGNADSYTWLPPTDLNTGNGANVVSQPQNSITYTVTGSVTGCSAKAMVTLSVMPLPVVTGSFVKSAVCLFETARLSATGGLKYEWLSPNGLIYEGDDVSFQVSSTNFAGTYTLTGSDKNNCRAKANALLEVLPLPNGYLTGKDEDCVPFCAEYQFRGFGAAVTSTWVLNNRTQAASVFKQCFGHAGTFTINGLLLDTLTGCRSNQAFVVRGNPRPAASFTWEPGEPLEGGEEVTFTNSSQGERQTEWGWYFDNDRMYHAVAPLARYTYPEAGRYVVAMVVKNEWGCSDTAINYLDIGYDVSIYLPNVFTPNGDGMNDVFAPVTRGIKDYSIAVFDRWGELIFQSFDPQIGWDGTYLGESCKTDVYTWQVTYSTSKGDGKKLTGHVTVLR